LNKFSARALSASFITSHHAQRLASREIVPP
jgi:hypothetical protein